MHPMGSGGTMGDAFLTTINNNGVYLNYNAPVFSDTSQPGSVHTSLLGDPTLRAHIVAPVSDVFVEHYGLAAGQFSNYVSWTQSPDHEVIGYHVYRATSANVPFTRISGTTPITTTAYNDISTSTSYVYMVRAVKLEGTYSGSCTGSA